MTREPIVQKVDHLDPRVIAAERAERDLFQHYGLEYRAHSVDVPNYGVRLRVLETGSGPPLVVIPGGNGDVVEMVPMIAGIEGRRVIAINRPGAGMSDAVDYRSVDVRRLALDSLTAVLDAFDLRSVPFAVNSMGGLWTLWLARERPERVAGMVQFGCPALILGTAAPLPMRFLSVPYVNRVLFRAFRAKRAGDVRDMLGMLGCTEGTRARLPGPYVEAIYRMFELPTYRLSWLSLLEHALTLRGADRRIALGPAALAEIEQPTLFVWGDNDVFGGLDIGRQAVSLMPDAELKVIAGSHVPYIDSPDECARQVNQFLRRQESPPLTFTARTRQAG